MIGGLDPNIVGVHGNDSQIYLTLSIANKSKSPMNIEVFKWRAGKNAIKTHARSIFLPARLLKLT